jgi:hypothetical protein
MMETLAIEEIISERELETRRSLYKRIVLSISTKARNLWMGVRRRMNERDARLAAEAAKPRPQAPRPSSTNPDKDGPLAGEAAADQRVDEHPPVSGEQTATPIPEAAGQETESMAAGA